MDFTEIALAVAAGMGGFFLFTAIDIIFRTVTVINLLTGGGD